MIVQLPAIPWARGIEGDIAFFVNNGEPEIVMAAGCKPGCNLCCITAIEPAQLRGQGGLADHPFPDIQFLSFFHGPQPVVDGAAYGKQSSNQHAGENTNGK